MSHRFVHHVTLARPSRGISRNARRLLHQQHKRQVKRATFRDCGRRCVYCGTALGLENATLDHVIPLSRGGSHQPGNLVAMFHEGKLRLRMGQFEEATAIALPSVATEPRLVSVVTP